MSSLSSIFSGGQTSLKSGQTSLFKAYSGPPVLGGLSLSKNVATINVAFSANVVGRTAGSTLALSGTGSAGLSVNSTTGVVSGTPTTLGTVSITETLAGATGSPKANASVLTVANALAPSTASFLIAAGAGSVISTITGLAAGETVVGVVPNDGRLAIAGGNQVVIGLTASSAGLINAILTTSGGRTLAQDITANDVVIVSPTTLDLPAGKSSFWSLFKSTGYSGMCLRVQRSSDAAELDIGFDGNQMLNQGDLLNFVGLNTGYVTKWYSHGGAVDAVQTTQSLMPIIAQGGLVQKTDGGIPCIKFSGGRYLSAAGAFTPLAGSEFSLNLVAMNDNAQGLTSTTAYTPVIGATAATPSNNTRWHFLFGQRSSFSRSMMFEMASSAQASNEVTGWSSTISARTATMVTVNCQAAALSGGPGAGSTLYYNRAKQDDGTTSGTVDNALHSPASLTTVADIRIGAFCNSGWQTNTANGSSCGVTSVYLGTPLTDAQRQAFEQAMSDKMSKIIVQNSGYALPALGTKGDAWNFATYSANKVVGVKGNADLNMQTAANGSTFSLAAPVSGIAGVYEGVTNNFQNDFEASNTLGWNQRSYTMWSMVTVDDIPAARIFDFIVHGTGTLGSTASRYISSGLSKDHSPLCAYSLDSSAGVVSDYTNLMNGGDAVTGAPAWMAYSPFMGGGMLGVNVPGHDYSVDHPPFYTKKHFLRGMGTAGANDNVQYQWGRNKTFLLLQKHQPHPNYDFAKAYNDPANIPWRNKATLVVKVAEIGGLDGFDKVPGARVDHINRAATTVCGNTSRIRHYGGENLNTLKGYTHALGFIPKFTSDSEDQALFYALTNPSANFAQLAAA